MNRIWIVILAALIAHIALAQSDRGTITGTVSDPGGGVVPNAALILSHTGTGAKYETVTTGTGNFTLPSLPSGVYNLAVSASGFSQYVQEGIRVQVAQTARIDVRLAIGATTESVTVQADAQLLRTESAEQSLTITGDKINQLPLTMGGNNLYGARNPLASLSLAPGVYQVVGTNFTFRVNGSSNSARYLLDGQDITTLGMTSEHLSESHPSVEALQEVTLQSSNFAAEFGQVQGGLVNFTTRSGSNQIHGSAYDYFMNEFLNAGRPFTDNGNGKLIRPRQRNNNFGFTVGGPVFLPKLYDGRSRTFFFFNFDQFRNRATVSGAATTVPTEAYRRGDFSGALTGRRLGTNTDPLGRPFLENTIYDPATEQTVNGQLVRNPFPGNIVPQNSLDPVALKIQSLIPMPTFSGNINNLAVVDQTASTTTLPSVKLDHHFSSKTKMSFYWGGWFNTVPKSAGDGKPFPVSNAREFITYTNTYRLTLDRTITPTFLLHLGVGEIRYDHVDSNPATTRDFDAPGKLGLTGGLGNPTGFPGITGLSANAGGLTGNMGWTNGVRDYDDKPTWVASATLVKNNHTFKFGGEWWKDIWSFIRYNTAGSFGFSAAQTALPYLQTTNVSGGSIGFPYASFLLGAADNASIRNVSDPQVRKHGIAFYAQDTWKVTRRLTLDYGIRWDYQTGWHELHSRSSSFAPHIPNPSAGGLLGATAYEGNGQGKCNCSFTDTYPWAIGPRLGVAWQINNKTVLRAGWGFVFGQTPVLSYFVTAQVGVGFNTLNFATPSYGQPSVFLRDGLKYDASKLFAATLDPGVRPEPGTITSPPSYLDPTGGRPSRINQWNISLQRELAANLVLEAAYVGNRSAWILGNSSVNWNALSPEMLAARGFNVSDAADRSVLIATWGSAAAQARGITSPYAGYPAGNSVAQRLRPYPQFGNIGVQWAQRGFGWYDSLQAKLTKRYSHGIEMSGSFTWQKELEYGSSANNVYNKEVNKNFSSSSQPFVLAIGLTYRTPAVTANRVLRSAIRDWTVGSFLRYSSGLPIQVPSANNNLNTLLFQSTYMNRVPGQALFTKDLNCHCYDPNKDFVLNPAAWTDPAPGQFGTSARYYNDYRYQRHPVEQIGIGRIFAIRESKTVELRFEFFNVFNRTQPADPSSGNAAATQQRDARGVPIGGFGWINSQSLGNASTLDNPTGLGGNPRQGQLLLRVRF